MTNFELVIIQPSRTTTHQTTGEPQLSTSGCLAFRENGVTKMYNSNGWVSCSYEEVLTEKENNDG